MIKENFLKRFLFGIGTGTIGGSIVLLYKAFDKPGEIPYSFWFIFFTGVSFIIFSILSEYFKTFRLINMPLYFFASVIMVCGFLLFFMLTGDRNNIYSVSLVLILLLIHLFDVQSFYILKKVKQ